MKCRMLAIDVDGTMLGPDHRPRDGIRGALLEAAAAGVRVVPATGRSYAETLPVLREIGLASGPEGPAILVGGALVSERIAGRTLYQNTIPRDTARRYADALNAAGYAAAVLVDAWRHGFDYYMAESSDVSDIQRNWFDKMRARVRRVRRLSDAADMPEPLRINTVVAPGDAAALEAGLAANFAGRLRIHSIFAPNYGVTVVEAFAAGAGKWPAIQYLAGGWRIPRAAIAAIGDDVNDMDMLREAGLGAAMPQSPPPVRAAAGVIVGPSLPEFIRKITGGDMSNIAVHGLS